MADITTTTVEPTVTTTTVEPTVTTTTEEPTVTTTTAEPPKKDEKLSALIAGYKKSYPKEKTFHVTSDNQVFLSKDLDAAKLHQKSVSAESEVQTIKA